MPATTSAAACWRPGLLKARSRTPPSVSSIAISVAWATSAVGSVGNGPSIVRPTMALGTPATAASRAEGEENSRWLWKASSPAKTG